MEKIRYNKTWTNKSIRDINHTQGTHVFIYFLHSLQRDSPCSFLHVSDFGAMFQPKGISLFWKVRLKSWIQMLTNVVLINLEMQTLLHLIIFELLSYTTTLISFDHQLILVLVNIMEVKECWQEKVIFHSLALTEH